MSTSSSSSRREAMRVSRTSIGNQTLNDENSNPNQLSFAITKVAANKEKQATVLSVELLSKLARSIPLNKVHRLDLDIRNQNLPPITHITGLHNVLNLKVLSLSGNSICYLEGLSCLRHLVELNLSENNLRTLDNVETNLSTSLVRLNLTGNKIQRIPASLSTLIRLSVLCLARNDLEVVGDLQHLRSMHRLRHLRLEDNPFSAIEKTIPYALFCVPSLDTINGCEIMPNERRDASQRFQHLESNHNNNIPAVDTTTSTSHTENTTGTTSKYILYPLPLYQNKHKPITNEILHNVQARSLPLDKHPTMTNIAVTQKQLFICGWLWRAAKAVWTASQFDSATTLYTLLWMPNLLAQIPSCVIRYRRSLRA